MDISSLVTPKDDYHSIQKHKYFLIINIGLMIIFIAVGIGWIVYAKKKSKWPYQKYIRSSCPGPCKKASELNLDPSKNGSNITEQQSLTTQDTTTTATDTTTTQSGY